MYIFTGERAKNCLPEPYRTFCLQECYKPFIISFYDKESIYIAYERYFRTAVPSAYLKIKKLDEIMSRLNETDLLIINVTK